MTKRILFVAASILFVTPTVQGQPAITAGGTVNAADYSRDFAPGAIISIFGTNLASTSDGARSLPLPTTLGGGTSVELVSAASTQTLPLFYVSPTQINAELPYGLTPGTVQLLVRTASGASATDSISVLARAPKIFTVDFSGKGAGIVTDPAFRIATQGGNPVKPGDSIIIWLNSLGETNPPAVAGNAAPSSPFAVVTAPVNVMIGGKPAKVTFAGAAPGFSGLYQVNVEAPFLVLTGPVDIQVTVDQGASQQGITTAYRQLGFFNAILGGKAVAAQTVNGLNALAFRQSDSLAYGNTGFGQWTRPGAPSIIDTTVSGETLTLKSGAAVVFDNNGIEDQSGASFYSNAGGGADSQKPGLVNLYSMSNYFPLVFSTYVKLAQPATVSEMIGYFDARGTPQVPFDPNNPYVKYRMNVWSNAGGLPKETGSYSGDVFSSDSASGTFTVSPTGVNRLSSVATAAPEAIWRLDYKLNSPITLPAGEYWFSYDAAIRDNPAVATSTSSFISPSELADIIRMQPQSGTAVRFSFFGREMMYQESWILPFNVAVRPESPLSTKQF